MNKGCIFCKCSSIESKNAEVTQTSYLTNGIYKLGVLNPFAKYFP